MAGRLAPVADGTFDGRWFHVSNAISANAAASLASDGNPNSSEERIFNPRGRSSLASMASKVGLLTPPPDTTYSSNCFLGRNDKSAYSVRDRASRECRCRGDNVLLAGTSAAFHELPAQTHGQILRVPQSLEACEGKMALAELRQQHGLVPLQKPRFVRRDHKVCRKDDR